MPNGGNREAHFRTMRSKQRFPKTGILYGFVCLLFAVSFSSCDFGGGNKGEWKDPELVEVKDTDRSIQYYLPMNIQAWANGQAQTTNDLRASGRLLLTSGGNVKAMEFSDGYKKVYSFRCEPIGGGWYKITCWLRSSLTGDEYSHECYTRERI